MTDILEQIVAVKRAEVAAATQRKPLAAMRADAESRVLTRDFVAALRAKIAAGHTLHPRHDLHLGNPISQGRKPNFKRVPAFRRLKIKNFNLFDLN